MASQKQALFFAHISLLLHHLLSNDIRNCIWCIWHMQPFKTLSWLAVCSFKTETKLRKKQADKGYKQSVPDSVSYASSDSKRSRQQTDELQVSALVCLSVRLSPLFFFFSLLQFIKHVYF